MKKVLVLCTGNSCRSQMAEGYLKRFIEKKAQVFSAGLEPHAIDPRAIAAMKEDGIDISSQTSNRIEEYRNIDFDHVITVCDHTFERCPAFFSKAEKIHRGFPDPAKALGSEEEVMSQFRKVREEIKKFCLEFSIKTFGITIKR